METGLEQLHHYLGEALVAVPIVLVILALKGARTQPKLAKLMGRIHAFGLLMPGRLVYLVGLTLMYLTGRSITEVFILVGLIGWVPIEIVGKRLIKGELKVVADGGEASSKLLIGAIAQLLLVLTIVVAMEYGH